MMLYKNLVPAEKDRQIPQKAPAVGKYVEKKPRKAFHGCGTGI